MNPNTFLRRILALDAFSCAAMGTALAAGAGMLAPLFGLPEPLLRWAGLLLLPLAALLVWLSSREAPPSRLVWAVIVGNVIWTVESVVVLSTNSGTTTVLGTAFVAGQALAVLGLAALEWIGVRRARAIRVPV